jgi:hypothetical protein
MIRLKMKLQISQSKKDLLKVIAYSFILCFFVLTAYGYLIGDNFFLGSSLSPSNLIPLSIYLFILTTLITLSTLKYGILKAWVFGTLIIILIWVLPLFSSSSWRLYDGKWVLSSVYNEAGLFFVFATSIIIFLFLTVAPIIFIVKKKLDNLKSSKEKWARTVYISLLILPFILMAFVIIFNWY